MKIRILLTCFCALLSLSSYAFDYGDLDANKFPPAGWVDTQWNDPGGWTTINVNNNGIPKNDNTVDAGAVLQSLVAANTGNKIYYFPAGTYHFKTKCQITKGGVQIKGDGPTTIFKLDFPGTQVISGIVFQGGDEATTYTLNANANRGDNQITLTNSAGIAVNDYLRLEHQKGNDADETMKQIVRVTAKNGNTLTLDMKLGVVFDKTKTTVYETNLIANIKVSDFKMERVRANGKFSNNLVISKARNILVTDIVSRKSPQSHIKVGNCRDGLITQCDVADGFGGGGGWEYGITIPSSTRVNVINNVAADLRHHYSTQFGTSHCVIAYNVANAPYNAYADFGEHNSKGCHNNLWEGNFGEELYNDNFGDNFGTEYTTYFRNHAKVKVGSEEPLNSKMNLIGNEVEANGIKTSGTNHYVGANRKNTDANGNGGTMVWGALSATDDIPESLFLTAQPAYAASWPLYGPDSGGTGGSGGTTTVEAESYNSQNGITLYTNDGGTTVGFNSSGSWIKFNNVNFHGGVTQIRVRVSSNAGTTPGLEFRLGSETGTLLGSVNPFTGSWTGYQEMTVNITNTTGVNDLVIVRTGGQSRLNWFEFDYAAGGSGGGVTTRIQTEDYNAQNSTSLKNNDGGVSVSYDSGSAWTRFNNVDLGSGIDTITFRCSSNAGTTPGLEVRLGSETGTLIGTINPTTGGWTTYQNKDMAVTTTSGIQTLVIVKTGGQSRVNWIEFTTL